MEGEVVHYSAADINVKIIKPFENISTGLHIPYFSRPYHSFEGDYGEATAEYLLKKLYDIGCYLNSEMVKIRENFDHAKKIISNIPNKFGNEAFKRKRKELKQSLKRDECSSKAYQKELALLRKKQKKFNEKTNGIMDAFLSDSFPMIIPYGMRKQILDLIEGKKHLTNNSTIR